MPELPEVETIRRELDREVVGKRIKSVEASGERTLRRHKSPKEFVAKLEGAKISGVERRGKYLVFKLDTGDLLRLQDVAANNFVHHALVDYVVRVVTATRRPEQFGMPDVKAWVAFGASPRASLGIIAASRALALVRGRDYVVPQDVIDVIPDVLRHRLVLTYDALADDVKAETVINRILQTVALPQVNAVPQQGHSVPPVGAGAAAPQSAPAAAGR